LIVRTCNHGITLAWGTAIGKGTFYNPLLGCLGIPHIVGWREGAVKMKDFAVSSSSLCNGIAMHFGPQKFGLSLMITGE